MPLLNHWMIGEDGGDTIAPPPVIPADINQPNPAETVWRLGIGGVPFAPAVRIGDALILNTSFFNNGVLLSYSPDPLLEAVVWTGGGQPNGFFPQIEWISAPASSVRLAVPASATAGLAPGRYRFRVGLTVQGVRLIAYDGIMELVASPGASDSPRQPYVDNEDLEFYYPQVRNFQDYTSDQAAFLGQRVDASDKLDRMILNRYMGRPGYTRTRSATYDPILGYDVPDPTAPTPTKAQLTAWLAANGLVVDPVAREIVARMAVAILLDRQETLDQNPYRDHSQAMRDRVAQLWATFQAQVDADADSDPDWLIDMDATSLPAGAAP